MTKPRLDASDIATITVTNMLREHGKLGSKFNFAQPCGTRTMDKVNLSHFLSVGQGMPVVQVETKKDYLCDRLEMINCNDNTDSLTFVQEFTKPNVASDIAEGGKAPPQMGETKNVVVTVKKRDVPTTILSRDNNDSNVTDQCVNNRLTENIKINMENQIINGTGANGQMNGIEKHVIQTVPTGQTDKIGEYIFPSRSPKKTVLDDLFAGLEKFYKNAGEQPNILVLNNLMRIHLMSVKDTQGNYIWPKTTTNLMRSGIQLIGSDHVTDNNGYFLNTHHLCYLTKGGTQIKIDQNNDDSQKDQVSILITYRAELVVIRPKSILKLVGINNGTI